MKNKIVVVISFLLGGLLFGTIGVYAATTLASSSVSYDNATSGSASSNVQGSVDELYNNASAGRTNIINSLNTKGLTLGSNSSYADIVSGINSLSDNAGEPVLLWTNPNPNNSFASQTVSLDLSNYASVIIYLKNVASDVLSTSGHYVPKGYSGRISIQLNGRYINSVTNEGINFGTGYSGGSASNSYAIPCEIYGVPARFEIATENIAMQEWLTQANVSSYTTTKDYEYITTLSGNTVSLSKSVGQILISTSKTVNGGTYYYYVFKDVTSGTKFTPATTTYGMQITGIPYVN